jgi:hypothetical protein
MPCREEMKLRFLNIVFLNQTGYKLNSLRYTANNAENLQARADHRLKKFGHSYSIRFSPIPNRPTNHCKGSHQGNRVDRNFAEDDRSDPDQINSPRGVR